MLAGKALSNFCHIAGLPVFSDSGHAVRLSNLTCALQGFAEVCCGLPEGLKHRVPRLDPGLRYRARVQARLHFLHNSVKAATVMMLGIDMLSSRQQSTMFSCEVRPPLFTTLPAT